MEKELKESVENLHVLQEMIILSAGRLDGLRTQCSTSAEITQHEIRTLEGKLVKLFSQQITKKQKIPVQNLTPDLIAIPSLKLWLQIVGLNSNLIKSITLKVSNLESLKDKSETEVQSLMYEHRASEEENRRLGRALCNLKRYCELVRTLEPSNKELLSKEQQQETTELLMSDFYWDSWDMHDKTAPNTVGCCTFPNSMNIPSPRLSRVRAARSSVPSEEYFTNGQNNHSVNSATHSTSCSTTPCTPVTNIAPISLTSPNYSPDSHPNIYSPTNSSVFSPSSTSPCSFDPDSTPPSTPPVNNNINKGGKDKKFPITPPARKKLETGTAKVATKNLQPENFPLTKSKSHESQLGNRIDSSSENNLVSPSLFRQAPSLSSTSTSTTTTTILINNSSSQWLTLGHSLDQLPAKRRERLPTEPGPNSAFGTSSTGPVSIYNWGTSTTTSGPYSTSPTNNASPIKSPPVINSQNNQQMDNYSEDLDTHNASLQVPKSPRTPTLARSMGHVISHRFTKMFKVSTCDYCFKQVIIGLKCKECKFKCHRDCESKVPPSCGLPAGFIDVFRDFHERERDSPIVSRFNHHFSSSTSSSPSALIRRERKMTRGPGNMHVPPFSGPDSSSNTSSCNSSTPSSPALFASTSASSIPSYNNNLFHFPECSNADTEKEIPLERRQTGSQNDMTCTEKSNDSDRTVSQTSGSTDSEKTLALRVDSQDSQISDGEERNWPRQNSLSNREWDIPFDELQIGDKIGTGHFGTVYRGNWHGPVAIKVLDLTALDNEKTLEQFKQEVAIFRKTRHENLVLFMGACMKPPRLAIVTSMCRGMSLFTHIHLRKDKFNLSKIVLVAQQISQGMGYLHARGIVHKDLKSKNIFLESGKVVITDFGLFSVTKLLNGVIKGDQELKDKQGDSLSIPPGWLCYLAPEIMRCLRPKDKIEPDLPFTKTSDTYAFGTVWYELLCGEWPYSGLPPEAIIWQVCSGVRQSLPAIYSREHKILEILMTCWSNEPEDRMEYTQILRTLDKLPKKRLARSPSHPIHLSRITRSAESVF